MIFHVTGDSLKELKELPFKMEQELQSFFESHLQTITGYQILQTEFTVGGYRMDSVGFDIEQQAFVIIEYKRGQNESLVDQGYAYLSTVLDRRADFVLLYNTTMNENKTVKHFDWSQTRIVFVSPGFTKYQKDAAKLNSTAFELYEVKRYEGNIIAVDRINENSNLRTGFSGFDMRKKVDKASNPVISKVEKEIKVYDLQYHYEKAKANQFVRDVFEEMRDRILQFDTSIVEKYTKHYIVFKYEGRRNIVSFWLRGTTIEVVLAAKRGEIADPYQITYDISNRSWSSEQYALLLTPKTNLDEVMDLIRRTHKANKERNK